MAPYPPTAPFAFWLPSALIEIGRFMLAVSKFNNKLAIETPLTEQRSRLKGRKA